MGKPNINRMVHWISISCNIFIFLFFMVLQSSPVEAESPAFIRIVHASPDVGTVDVFMDGTKLLSSFQYATVSNYLPLPGGSHSIKIALIGKGTDAPVITQTFPANAGKAYTIAALGMQSTKSLSLEVFEDDNSISGNTAKVRVYHLSPGTGSVDATENTRKIVQGLSYSQASGYTLVPAGTYTFNVTVLPANATIPVSTVLKPWTVTSFFAIGLLNSDPPLKFITAQVTGIPALPQTGGSPITNINGSHTFPFRGVAIWASLLMLVICSVYGRLNIHFYTKRK